MGHSLMSTPPPRRSEEMLDRAPAEDGVAPYDIVAPGLYPDESAVVLDEGSAVAVSVERRRLPTGAGVAFTAWARWIEGDGATMLDAHGQEVETIATWTADPPTLDRHGADALAREMLLAVLGEAPTLLPPGPDLELPERPVIAWTDEWRANVSVRAAIACCRPPASPDAAALLSGAA